MSEMLRDSLKALLPMIRVTTNDPISVEQVLQSIAQSKHVQHVDTLSVAVLYKADTVLWSDNPKIVTTDNWETLHSKERSLVLVNVPANDLMFEAGELLPPSSLLKEKVGEYSNAPDLSPLLAGLSLKAVEELLRLTSVKFGNLLPTSIKSMRAMLGVPIQGLYPVDTHLDFYHPYKPLQDWLELNHKYFMNAAISPVLRPRGLLLDGLPGTGKTSAAKYIASTMGVPLYRLDIATSLNKYIGESEVRMMRILRQLEEYSPCIVLVDEVEKVFVSDSDSGVVQRMMAQLLWWLSEHRSQVLTVMTTNNRHKIPPELFREGRINDVLEVPPMNSTQALELAQEYLRMLIGPKITLKHTVALKFNKGEVFTAVQVINTVISTVKKHQWCV
jgi:hypothetical protein